MTQHEPASLAIITGAGGGLAPAVAHVFASAGYRLALVTRPGGESSVAGLLQQLPTSNHAVVGIDLASAEACARGFNELEESMGQAGALLNIAGGYGRGGAASDDRTAQLAERTLESMLTTNLRTAVNATSAVLPGMLARGAGFIAAVSAGAAQAPTPGATAYAASKAALSAYFRSLAAEVGGRGVNVAVLVPVGAIDTPANSAAMPKADPSGWLDPNALAEGLLYLSRLSARGRVHELVMTAS